MSGDRDPGDAVPPGVAPIEPVPLTEEDEKVLEQLELLGDPDDGKGSADADADADAEVERMMQTVEPHSDAPSRSGITGTGSGADGQGL